MVAVQPLSVAVREAPSNGPALDHRVVVFAYLLERAVATAYLPSEDQAERFFRDMVGLHRNDVDRVVLWLDPLGGVRAVFPTSADLARLRGKP